MTTSFFFWKARSDCVYDSNYRNNKFTIFKEANSRDKTSPLIYDKDILDYQ